MRCPRCGRRFSCRVHGDRSLRLEESDEGLQVFCVDCLADLDSPSCPLVHDCLLADMVEFVRRTGLRGLVYVLSLAWE